MLSPVVVVGQVSWVFLCHFLLKNYSNPVTELFLENQTDNSGKQRENGFVYFIFSPILHDRRSDIGIPCHFEYGYSP